MRRGDAAVGSVGFDGGVSPCVFGWEEDRDGISVRRREKAQALIATPLGS
ncbi:hypothetical protein [Pseudonocardia xishanensis]|uniref:Uncharacterized protein n=1 Tax=Pseudonocardia xishanensis TaxID=630995 RepID=A0ABP8RX27_9PSEU